MDIGLLENPIRNSFALANIGLFLVVGVWLLHRRFALLEELSLRAQAVVVCWAALTCGMELVLLRATLERTPVLHIFTAIGFFVAAFALYGHVAVSLISKILVDMVLTPADEGLDHPRTGSAAALERSGDNEGAAREYLALARIYPGNPALWTSAGGNFAQAGQPHEAAVCFEKALALLSSPGDALLVFWRCAALFHREEGEDARIGAMADDFIRRFTGSREAETVARWLERRRTRDPGEEPSVVPPPERQSAPPNGAPRVFSDNMLERLEDHPLGND